MQKRDYYKGQRIISTKMDHTAQVYFPTKIA